MKIRDATLTTPSAAQSIPIDSGDNVARRVTIGTLGESFALLSVNAQTGTTYQFVLSDGAGNIVVSLTNAAPITVTVPANATVAFPVGTVIGLVQGGAGKVTLVSAGGVQIRSKSSYLSLSGQWAPAALQKIATDEWLLVGSLVA